MILADFSKIAHWESAGGKVNFQVIAVLSLSRNNIHHNDYRKTSSLNKFCSNAMADCEVWIF